MNIFLIIIFSFNFIRIINTDKDNSKKKKYDNQQTVIGCIFEYRN